MKKSLVGNIILMILSIVITMILSEYIFRWVLFGDNEAFVSLRDPSYYATYIKHKNRDFHNEDYWKLNYLFNKKFNIEDPHPLLGRTGLFHKKTLNHFDQDKVKDRRPVLLYGDSYAACAGIAECFEDILNRDTAFAADYFLLNYGVAGYGVDQIYLLFKETVDKFENPFVIFSLLTEDLDRSMLNVRDAQKPYFVLTDKGLELQGVPITLSSRVFFEQNPPEINSYLWNKFKNSDLYPFVQNEEEKKEYIQKIKTLNKAILQEVFRKLKALNTDYVILIFQPEYHTHEDWRLTFLRELCQENEVPYICDLDVRNADSTFSTYDSFNYSIKGDGHPTSYANALLSKELKRYIFEPDYRKDVFARNANWKKRVITKGVEYFKKQIHNTPEWIEDIKSKAIDRGISLDSMITLDAQYMLNQEE